MIKTVFPRYLLWNRSFAVKNFIIGSRRNLSIHEYLSANILKDYGINVPSGGVAKSPEEAVKIAEQLGVGDFVVKAQVLTGGRGKGVFDSGLKGGVKVGFSPKEVGQYAGQMLGYTLVTKQTGPSGKICNMVYVCERKFSRKECYIAILMDRTSYKPMIVVSSQGGVDIETVAKETPELIYTVPIDISKGVSQDIASSIADKFGFSEKTRDQVIDIILKLYKVFIEKDATQIEINPLSETIDYKIYAMDAKFGFDDNAEFRQTEIFSLRDKSQEDPDEIKASSLGLNFIKLDGSIGCLVNGAGLAMATMDIIKLNGGEPANFLDVGGSASAESIKEAFTLIVKDPKVTTIFVNIFGGIVRCDYIAQGLVSVMKDLSLSIPIVVRLQGTKYEEAQDILNNSGLQFFSYIDLDEAAYKACYFSKIIKLSRDIDVDISFKPL
ncbi:hypothetical protein T552_01904 [Pneumocystis carinii B80]|uniref:Succinate--CoA ligase [ADP-forming] subunit beta, mitochondrial n=1 Tax=Pneumocystis carinii (strain B80) TaxID=1408658 RepID=A0A0W4ZI55_PNEC8|nr:hypothetical protein T552_01904 [Pneumocystis carinii B80]KTW28042.1 hypothetical protein T552_01904 [Pneumocystis carinii B80]